MNKKLISIGILAGIFIIALLVIFLTLPSNNKTPVGPGGKPVSTPTLNLAEKLKGKNIEGQLLFTRKGFLWGWRGDTGARLAIEPGGSVAIGEVVTLRQPAISPLANQIAYIRQDESFSDLWVVNADGTNARSLTNHKGRGVPRTENFVTSALWAFSPTWSPDGKQIAYLADARGQDDLALWVVNAGGGQPRRLPLIGQGTLSRPSWSPDGTTIAVTGYENAKPQIYTVKVSGGQVAKLTSTPEGAYDPAWSADGSLLAYVVRKGNGSELWYASANGANAQLVSDLDSRNPVWSPKGTKIAFLGMQSGGFEIFVADLNQGRATFERVSDGAGIDSEGGLSWGK
jgi:TolB protein